MIVGREIWLFISLLCATKTICQLQDIGTCNFNVNECDYYPGSESDFQWMLAEEKYLEVKTEMHNGGERALLYSPEIKQQDTHCYSFQYHMEGDTGDAVAGQLNVYVLVGNDNLLENPVWSANTSSGASGWTEVQLALVPKSYKVVFEAFVTESTPGLMAIDNIEVSKEACSRAPHFLRLGDKEVNMGQNLTMKCLLYGFHMKAEKDNSSLPKTEVVLQSTKDATVYHSNDRTVYNDHLGVNFRFNKLTLDRDDKYRCVARNHSEVGISNYATVTVKEPPVPVFAPEVVEAGSTFLKLNLNTKAYDGDGIVVQKILSYRPSDGLWADVHDISTTEYDLWHLQPDTDYIVSIKLSRPGLGGAGIPGPSLTTTTKCGVPLRSVSSVKVIPSGSTSLSVSWKKPDFSVTLCHFYTFVVKYRKHTNTTNDNLKVVKYDFTETEDNYLTINGLEKFTMYDIKIILKNSAAEIETGIYTAKTGQDVPGPVGDFGVVFVNETAITLSWVEPQVKNGEIEMYEVVYRGTSSLQPDYTPQLDTGRFEVSKVERTVTLWKLHPGTTYVIDIHARTATGYGKMVEITAETNIAPPTMPEYPSPSTSNNTLSPTTIEITLLPAATNGAPITHYYVVVAEVPSEPDNIQDESKNEGKKPRKGRRRKNKKTRVRRQADDSSSACYAAPISFEDAKKNNQSYYFGAQFAPTDITDETKYLVGGGTSVGGFTNPPLDPNKEYKIFVRADSIVNGQTKSSCILVAVKEKAAPVPVTTLGPPIATESPTTDKNEVANNNVLITDEATTVTPATWSVPSVILDDSDADKSTKDPVVFYAGIGGGIIIFLVIAIIIIIIILRRRKQKSVSKRTDEVVNPFEVRMMMTDVNNDSGHNTLKSQDRQHLMPDVVAYDQHTDFTDNRNSDQAPLMADFSGRTNDVPQNPAVRVDDFHIHVSQMRQSNNYGFSEEFATFRDGPTNTWEIANREENRIKNRYGNVMAYDHSRVILERIKSIDEYESDYINANYINGYKNPSMYIASQAPTPDTLIDFWSMIWQEKTPIIVMVTNLVELGKVKCHKYWPDEHEQYGMIRVSQSDEEVLSDYTLRTFVLQQADGYDALEVKQFHFTSWPDHGAPNHPTNLLAFIRKVKSYEPAGEGPTLVHCSAGAGRTGCYIVIDMMLDMARDEGIVDIYNTVTDLRTRRVNMVQTEEQYIFIHSAVLEALLCGITSVAANELRQHYDELITVDPQTQIAPVQEEFETLNLMTPKLLDTECSVARLPKNKAKNRFMDVLPADRHLAYLVTPDPQDPESNYINAVFADSYFLKNAFLITHMPLPSTVLDMWRLIYDYNCTSLVMMNDVSEHDQTCSQYWPDNNVMAFGPFTVELLSKEDEVDVVTRIFKLQNVNRPSEGYRIVQQFQLCNWPASQPVPYSRNAMLRVIQLVNKWQEECAKSVMGRVLVHCVAGAGRSGTFVACHNMCSQLKNEYAVDVFNIVQRLRNVRPQLVETLEQYRFCYEVGWDFAEQ